MKVDDLFNQRSLVAAKLKGCIRERGFTKASFARKAGISRPMLDEFLEENIDNERVFDDYTSKALVALNISINDLIEFVPKHKSTDTVCRESVPKDYRMSNKPESSTVCSWTFSNFARFIIEKLTGGRHEVLHSRLPLLS